MFGVAPDVSSIHAQISVLLVLYDESPFLKFSVFEPPEMNGRVEVNVNVRLPEIFLMRRYFKRQDH